MTDKCGRCGAPLSWPNHDGEDCQPPTPGVLQKLREHQYAMQRAGTEGAWRESGAASWQ